MPIIARTFSAVALAVAAVLVPTAAASAKPAPKAKTAARWAKKNHLSGAWRVKDADKDGLKNLEEFKLGTNPRKADTDRDGLRDADEITVGDDPTDPDTDGDKVKDGAEHAGVVTAFDGTTVTIRQFKGGKLSAPLADGADCSPAGAGDDDSAGDDSGDDSGDDGGYWGDDGTDSAGDDESGDDDTGAGASTADDDPTEVDLGAGDSAAGDDGSCGDAGVEKGAVIRSLELEDGAIVAVELAG
ncbi:hypothetical protein [Candidatus Solirubrobacter pratensis]|uniref:hypothetical protein n=1 Tax=Candidatus Solirubrobacter pratensis TaxID=1298857 RepID=UPI00041539E8|nr:hypothetical protein [Candidatus Solirubrobacter pratensis]